MCIDGYFLNFSFNINIKSDKKIGHCRSDFRKGNYREIRKHADWNDKIKNKSKRNFEYTLSQHIKTDSKICYACVRSN